MEIELTEKDIEAFAGGNQSYIDMNDRMTKKAPACHMRKMMYVSEYSELHGALEYWECSHCGHTRPIN